MVCMCVRARVCTCLCVMREDSGGFHQFLPKTATQRPHYVAYWMERQGGRKERKNEGKEGREEERKETRKERKKTRKARRKESKKEKDIDIEDMANMS